MMDMMDGAGAVSSDPLRGARTWAWVLPDLTDHMAALLHRLEDADAWNVGQQALAEAAARFEPYQERIPFDTITGWLMPGDPAHSNPHEHGYTGATDWIRSWFVGQYWAPDKANLYRLPAQAVHEMHHQIRNRLFLWGPQPSVTNYIMVEGTAESFADGLFGTDKTY